MELDTLVHLDWRTTNNFFKAGSFLSVLVTSDKRYWCFATSSQLSLRKLFLVILVFKGWRFFKGWSKKFPYALNHEYTVQKHPSLFIVSLRKPLGGPYPVSLKFGLYPWPSWIVILQNKSSCLMDESLFGTKIERTNKFILVAHTGFTLEGLS